MSVILVLDTFEFQDDAYNNTTAKVDAAKAKFDTLTQMRSELASDRHKVCTEI